MFFHQPKEICPSPPRCALTRAMCAQNLHRGAKSNSSRKHTRSGFCRDTGRRRNTFQEAESLRSTCSVLTYSVASSRWVGTERTWHGCFPITEFIICCDRCCGARVYALRGKERDGRGPGQSLVTTLRSLSGYLSALSGELRMAGEMTHA